MTHRGVKNSAFAIAQSHQHRLVVASAMIRWIGVSGGKYGHILAGSAKCCVKLIRAMHPDVRQSFHNGVFGSASFNLEREAISVRTSRALRVVRDQLAVLEIPHGPGLFCAAAPTASANHLIERRPIGERIVSRVDDYQASATFDIALKLLAQVRRPIRSVII